MSAKMRISFLPLAQVLLVFSFVFFSLLSIAQLEVYRGYDIEVWENGIQLPDPWTGGMLCPQFSPIDINQDGIDDIFSFDRVNNRILIYINTDDTPGQMSYKFTMAFNHLFPEGLREWVLLRDYNCDGKPDIFTRAPNAIRVFKNISTPETGLAFETTGTQLFADYNFSGTPFSAPVYCLSVDLPAIHDHDGDGDLDIFTFTSDATTLYHFKSLASEQGDCESLAYETVNACYAYANESGADNTIFIGEDHVCGLNVFDPSGMGLEDEKEGLAGNDRLHAGGTLVFLDTNDDGYKEVMIADITAPNITMLGIMPSSEGLDSAYFQTTDFPNGYGTDVPINVLEMPGCYYFDQDNDGVSDLVCAPQNSFTHEDMNATWLYKNNGTETLPEFSLVSDGYYQQRTIDIGTGAVPVFADYNGDGLADMFVSNHRKSQPTGQANSRLWLYENTGTATNPSFYLVTNDYLNLSDLGLLNICVTFGDLDADGDADMILGDQSGRLYRYSNQAGAGNTFDMELVAPAMPDSNGEVIDVGQHATPQLIDIDADGKLDLVIGEKAGNLNYYKNTGTAQLPNYTMVTELMGEVQAESYFGINGFSFPHFFNDSAGTRYLLLGNELGNLQLYGSIQGNEEGQYVLLETAFLGIKEGDYSAPFVIDINTDLRPDLFLGQMGGGLGVYLALQPDPVPTIGEIQPGGIYLFPNPTTEILQVRLEGMPDQPALFTILDMTGREIKRFDRRSSANGNLSVGDLASGIYLLNATIGGKQRIGRFVKE